MARDHLRLLTTALTGVQPPRNRGWDSTVTVTVASSAGMQSPQAVSSWSRVSMRGWRQLKKKSLVVVSGGA